MPSNNIEKMKLRGSNTEHPVGIRNVYINEKGNLCIETSATLGNSSKGKINIEAMDDIQFKPGDDIILYSHHRAIGDNSADGEEKRNEVSVKATNGEDQPVKLQLNIAELLLTCKDKTLNPKYSDSSKADVFDLTINKSKGARAYLKLRARAIDLRCEEHGGIALQPKGFDNDGHMNKIKFEHGGGDGLEFGTFNTEHTSLFTEDYRFNKAGLWRMATRVMQESDKKDASDRTTYYKYKKQEDDTYDVIDETDEICDTNAIIKTANAFNFGKDRHAKMTSGGNLEIQTNDVYTFQETSEPSTVEDSLVSFGFDELDMQKLTEGPLTENEVKEIYPEYKDVFVNGTVFADGYKVTITKSPKIKLVSGSDIELSASGKLKLGGALDFGSNFSFGETDKGIEYQYKFTKKNAVKDCSVVRVTGINNSTSEKEVEGVTIPAAVNDVPGTATIAEVPMLDIIKAVNWMKTNNQGPWAN